VISSLLAIISIWSAVIGGIVLAILRSRAQKEPVPEWKDQAVIAEEPEQRRVVELPPQPGFIYVLFDSNKPDMVKVLGSRKMPSTPLEIVDVWRSVRLDVELQSVYDELRAFRIAGNWYNKDAVAAYCDHRLGKV
jgi:hypothetical protein